MRVPFDTLWVKACFASDCYVVHLCWQPMMPTTLGAGISEAPFIPPFVWRELAVCVCVCVSTQSGNTRPKCSVFPPESAASRTSCYSITDSGIHQLMRHSFFHSESRAACALGSFFASRMGIPLAMHTGGFGSSFSL